VQAPGQVQRASGEGSEGSGEGLGGFGAEPGSTAFRRRFRRRFPGALVQSQVRFNKVPEKVPEKVWEGLVQRQVRFNRICGHLFHGSPAEVFPARGFAARFRKICQNITLRLLGIPPGYFFFLFWVPGS